MSAEGVLKWGTLGALTIGGGYGLYKFLKRYRAARGTSTPLPPVRGVLEDLDILIAKDVIKNKVLGRAIIEACYKWDYAPLLGLSHAYQESSFGVNLYGDYVNGQPTSFGVFHIQVPTAGDMRSGTTAKELVENTSLNIDLWGKYLQWIWRNFVTNKNFNKEPFRVYGLEDIQGMIPEIKNERQAMLWHQQAAYNSGVGNWSGRYGGKQHAPSISAYHPNAVFKRAFQWAEIIKYARKEAGQKPSAIEAALNALLGA